MKKMIVATLFTVLLMSGGASLMAAEFTVYVVRHGEKAVAESNPPLNEKGQERARALAKLMAKVELQAVYSTPYRRTEQTVAPLAQAKGLNIQSYRAGEAEQLVRQLREQGENALVVGHSNTVPGLVRSLGGSSEELTEQHYGDLFVLHFRDDNVHQIRLMLPPY
ncbi:SixA phosphatase family protein [Pseudidiomarina insulisalsae]|uniref:Histidine phosphatase family protein n=1 Tax=Pseudidiomarina insulisalsae TaxID=575789 RepID=A0A432YM74_9GAMM|nr:phosphoglycerate mutase family protein [Pseudidiomarina insulisalsae]RUO62087.1 histidine phosphatase family protein [Pseudidiomarina insulisalsae]